LGVNATFSYTSHSTSVACDLILYLLLLKEKEDDFVPGCP